MSQKAALAKFFYSSAGRTQAQADQLAAKFDGKITAEYAAAMYKFLYSGAGRNSEQAIQLTEQWGLHKKGPLPVKYAQDMHKFFYSGAGRSADQALALVAKFYDISDLATNEIVEDTQAFYKFFYSSAGRSADQALALCEKVVGGYGRVNLEAFKKAHAAAYKSKSADAALADALKSVLEPAKAEGKKQAETKASEQKEAHTKEGIMEKLKSMNVDATKEGLVDMPLNDILALSAEDWGKAIGNLKAATIMKYIHNK